MKKTKVIGTILAASIALTATLSGCSLVSAYNFNDMEQVIAEVDITGKADFADSEIAAYAGAVDDISVKNVIKRDLVAYFINSGYSLSQSGASYSAIFEMLLDSLVNNSIIAQYSIMYLLKDKAETEHKSAETVMREYLDCKSESEKYIYILGENSVEVNKAWYSLLSSLNSAIDSYEQNLLVEDTASSGSGTRTTPTGVDAENEDYYPVKDGKVDYNVYTGYTKYLLDDSGAYKNDRAQLLKDKSTRSTRVRAYNRFIGNLVSSGLVDGQKEDLHDLLSLEYIEREYVGQLESQLINKYTEMYEEERAEKLREGDYSYLIEVYDDLYSSQSQSYTGNDSYKSAMDSMSDSSFLLYAPNSENDDTVEEGTYGFVYNILLPFSTAQSAELTKYQSEFASNDEKDGLDYTPQYYTARASLLENITTVDQREAWFNGTQDYAFKAENGSYFDNGGDGWLFFENNLTNGDRYDPIEKYDGRYPYKGKVVKAQDDYVLVPQKLTIDDMLDEFTAYLNYALEGTGATASYQKNSEYLNNLNDTNIYVDASAKDKEVNWANFVYAKGKVDFTENDAQYIRHNLLKTDSDNGEASEQYKALAAANELQYAYTTDTGVLSNFVGYTVVAGDETGYVKEFEYAAQEAISRGAGAYAVCAADYGWHLIYVTYTFSPEGGAQYDPDWSNYNVEGTFEYNFYEMIKSKDIGNISSTRRTQIVAMYGGEGAVTKYESKYRDLLELSSEN